MSSKDQYIRKMQAKLDDWSAEIDALSAKAGKVTAGLRLEYTDQIESLRAKQTVARKKLRVVQQAGESAWEELKSGVEQAWTAMGEAIDSAKSRFK